MTKWKGGSWGSIQWHYSHVRFDENPLNASKIMRVTQMEVSWIFYDGFMNLPSRAVEVG